MASVRVRAAGCLGFLCAVLLANPGVAAEPTEAELKAAFLHTFARFVDYPPDRFQESRSPFYLCTFGNDPVKETLDEVTRGQSVDGHKILTKLLGQDDDVTSCHILFVGRSSEDQIASILNAVEGAGVLTISELDGFCERGGIVKFWVQPNPDATAQAGIRFEVNMDANERSGLRISSKVLRHARLLRDETPE